MFLTSMSLTVAPNAFPAIGVICMLLTGLPLDFLRLVSVSRLLQAVTITSS